MTEWGTIRVIQTTVSYLLSPAVLASDILFQIVEYAIPIPGKPQVRVRDIEGSVREIIGFGDGATGTVELTKDQVEDLRDTLDGSEGVSSLLDDPPLVEPNRKDEISTKGTSDDLKEQVAVPLLVHFVEESVEKIPLSTIPIQSILSIFNRRATACISSFELADLSAYSTMSSDERGLDGIGHTREPTTKEIEFVQEKSRDEVIYVEKIIEEALERSRVASLIMRDESRTYFEDMKMSFVSVDVRESGIDTVQFLEAVESLLEMFEQFASSAFALVQMNINENIRRIRVRYDVDPGKSRTLEDLVRNEKPERRKLGTESLLWLFRGLKFVHDSLERNLENPQEELMESFTIVWEAEYSRYFSWIVRPLFKLLIKACPTRDLFYGTLGAVREDVVRDMELWLEAMGCQVKRLENF